MEEDTHGSCAAGLVRRFPGAPAESSEIKSERHELRMIQAEQTAGALVEIRGGGGVTGAVEVGADFTPGVAFPACRGGSRAASRRGKREGKEMSRSERVS